jgi:hypothetical protein
MEVSHIVGVFVCASTGTVSKYFLGLSVKCSVLNNACQQCFSEVTNFCMAQHCYSKSQLWQLARWGKVQHSLNISRVFSKILRHVSICIIAFLQMISITVRATLIDWWSSAYFNIGLKVVVYLPSKDIAGNSVSSRIFLSWMNLLRYERVCTFRQPWDFSYCTYLSSCS